MTVRNTAIRAPRGATLTCKTWAAEGAYRMLQNNLDAEVAERPDDLVVYGGTGRAVRDWNCYAATLQALENLEPDETLLVQSGKPVGILPSHADAPRVLIANSNFVPRWATWETFHRLDGLGLTMFGQMTAGSWIYIGTQGIVQGTYETFAACGRKHFGDAEQPLLGRFVATSGLGGMGGAQGFAAKLAGGVVLCIEIDPARIQRRLISGYVDEVATSVDDALARVARRTKDRQPCAIALCGHAGDTLKQLLVRGVVPDVVTDQTSAHDPLNGYVPTGWSLTEAEAARRSSPARVDQEARRSIAHHVDLLLRFLDAGAVVFEYGNNLRGIALEEGVKNAFEIPGFVPEFIRPLFCRGLGPFRWAALSGEVEDIVAIDRELPNAFPENHSLQHWLKHGAPHLRFQGLPARICWLGVGERAVAGRIINDMVRRGDVRAPVVIGRDHLDGGSVASPNRETEAMKDGSDAIADWPFLNAMLNAVNGASWVSIHQGGGVGVGLSQHAGMVIVADGTDAAEARLERVLHADPATGVLRHVDAGYQEARDTARDIGLKVPMARWA